MSNSSSTLSLSFLALPDFSKYVVLKSEFSSNLVVLTISDWIPCIHLDILLLIYLVLGQSLLLLYPFPLLHLNDFCKLSLH